MRKKYLSALLFGALLFASAGTFTSCKDYDDDINNLQEQINTVVSDLASLKSQIDNLGTGVSSVTFDEATGVLTVVDGEGTHTYTIKTTAGEVADVKITIEGQELKVNGETVGKVGDTVTVVNGELTVNGEGTGIKVGEYTILDNQDAGTVTITLPDADGKLQTVVLAKASSALTSLKFEDDQTEFGGAYDPLTNKILWNVAATDKADWKGPKGAVKRNQLLVGQISTVNVQVTPASFDLGSAELSLQDSKGNPAPVKVSAIQNNMLLTRSTNSGSWLVSIEMNEDITADNIAKVFNTKDGQNQIAYALCVDGKPVSNYDIAVNVNSTADAANSMNHAQINGVNVVTIDAFTFVDEEGYKVSTADEKLPLGETTVSLDMLTDVDVNRIYDSYITFEGTNISLANSTGIKANGMTITAPATAAGTMITATVYMLDVTGKEYKGEVTFTVASEAAVLDATPIEYKVMPAAISATGITEFAAIEIKDLDKVFAKVDAATAEAVKTSSVITIEEEKDQKGFYIASDVDGTFASSAYQLLKADGKVWNQTTDDLTELTSIKFEVNKSGNNKIAKDAKPGKYYLYFVVNQNVDTNKKEIVRVKMEVNVTRPEFSELFTKRATAWNEAGQYVARITPSTSVSPWGQADAIINLSSAFVKAEGSLADFAQLGFTFEAIDNEYPVEVTAAYNGDKLNAVLGNAGAATLNKDIMYSEEGDKLVKSEMNNMFAYTSVLAGLASSQVESGATAQDIKNVQEAFTVVSESYSTKVETALNGVKPVYYVNGELQDADYVITLGADSNITPLNYNGTKPLDGFGLALNESVISAKCTLPNPSKFEFGGDKALDGYTVRVDPVSSMTEITDASLVQTISEGTITWGVGGDMTKGFEVTGLTVNQTATVNFILTDATGIEYPMSIEVIKK